MIPAKRSGLNAIFLLLFLLVSLTAFSADSESDSEKLSNDKTNLTISPSAVLDRLEDNMAGIKDLQAQMVFHIFVKRLGFPFSVNADYYFKAPDKVKIALHGLPGLLLGDAPKTITGAVTLTGFRKDFQTLYHTKLLGTRKILEKACYYLELTPIREDGNVSKTLLWVNRDDFTLPRLITNYKDGSWIQVNRTYSLIEKHLLVDHIDATMNFIKNDLKADVTASYAHYKINQGLSDQIFEEDKKTKS